MSDETTVNALLRSNKSFGTTLHALLLAKYGPEVYVWEPETVTLEVLDDYEIEIPPASFNKWAAMQTIMMTDAFFTRVDAFMAICNTLTFGEPYFTTFDPVSAEEIAWALAEVSLNREMLPLSRSVKGFIKLSMGRDGYTEGNMPNIVSLALDDGNIREEVAGAYKTDNNEALDTLLDNQIEDLVFQLDSIPQWRGNVNKFVNNADLVLPEVVNED